jgi:tripartite-type tricarboxylate transporter receptor subunit TctC
MWRRHLLLSALALAVSTGGAAAQAWPSKPIRMIVPWTAGSGTDTVARVFAEQLSAQLAQPIIVDNRPGAGGTIGVNAAAKAEPDGYTIMVHSSTHAVTAVTYGKLPYDPRTDLAAVGSLVSLPNVLVVAVNKGYNTVKDLVNAAKANPGKLNYASGGAGSGAHLNAERFMMAAGITAQHVPFKGGPEALKEIMSGAVDFYFVPLPPARGLIEAGKIGAIAVSNSKRASALPHLPTTVEAGYPDSEYNFWVGMFAPANTPKPVIDRLNAEIAKALEQPALKERLAKIGADPLAMTPPEFDRFVQREIDINAAIVKAVGVKIN